MTLEEIDKYINDIAYSGAVDFVSRCEESGDGSEYYRSLWFGILFGLHGSKQGNN